MNFLVNGNTIIVDDISPDMGEDLRMKLIQQEDGDVIISLYSTDHKHAIHNMTVEFCTLQGGGKNPVIAKKLRELVTALMDLKPNWKARALVRKKVVSKTFYADSHQKAQERAAEFFPTHNPDNISLQLLGRRDELGRIKKQKTA